MIYRLYYTLKVTAALKGKRSNRCDVRRVVLESNDEEKYLVVLSFGFNVVTVVFFEFYPIYYIHKD